MKTIILKSAKHGQEIVMIDDEDFEKAAAYNWSLTKHTNRFYAHRCIWRNGRNDEKVYMHRMIMGFPDGKQVEHIDNNGLNNQKHNLRIATNAQNQKNKPKYKNNTSGYKGVFVRGGLFKVQIRSDGKLIQGGYFKTAIEAAKRYNNLAIEYHGEFAQLNEIKV